MSLKGAVAIAGLGQTRQGKVYDRSHMGFAVAAVQLALEDAGLAREDLDGLLLNPGLAWGNAAMGSFMLQQALGLRDLKLQATINLGGATAAAMIQHAALAIAAGMCTTVACVFSDRPLKSPEEHKSRTGAKEGSAASYAFARGLDAATFSVYVVVSRMSERSGADTLDSLLAGSGAGSVKTALESGGTLGGSCSTMRVTRATPISLSMGGVEFFAYEYEVEAYG